MSGFLNRLQRAWIAFRLDDLDRKRAVISSATSRLLKKEINMRMWK